MSISQDRLRQIGEYQATVWHAQEVAHSEVSALMKDLANGATIEPGPLEYDVKLRMVRTRKVREA